MGSCSTSNLIRGSLIILFHVLEDYNGLFDAIKSIKCFWKSIRGTGRNHNSHDRKDFRGKNYIQCLIYLIKLFTFHSAGMRKSVFRFSFSFFLGGGLNNCHSVTKRHCKYLVALIVGYRIVSNKRSPSNKRPLTYFQIKLGKMPKFLYGVSL